MGFFSNLFGGGQAKAIEKASKVQANTAKQNMALGQQYVTDSLGDLDTALAGALGQLDAAGGQFQPYADVGAQSLSQIANLFGLNGREAADAAMANFQTTPGYGFRMDQGVSALDRSAASKGGLYSGAQGKALTEFGQGLASQEYGNYVNGLSALMGQGYNAAGGISGLLSDRASAILGQGANRANVRSGGLSAITGANTQVGQAQAGGLIGSANARAQGANNIAGLLTGGISTMLGRLPLGGGGGGAAGYVGGGNIPIPGSNPYFA